MPPKKKEITKENEMKIHTICVYCLTKVTSVAVTAKRRSKIAKAKEKKVQMKEDGRFDGFYTEMIYNTLRMEWNELRLSKILFYTSYSPPTQHHQISLLFFFILKRIQEKKRKMKKARTRGLNTSMKATSFFTPQQKPSFLSMGPQW